MRLGGAMRAVKSFEELGRFGSLLPIFSAFVSQIS